MENAENECKSKSKSTKNVLQKSSFSPNNKRKNENSCKNVLKDNKVIEHSQYSQTPNIKISFNHNFNRYAESSLVKMPNHLSSSKVVSPSLFKDSKNNIKPKNKSKSNKSLKSIKSSNKITENNQAQQIKDDISTSSQFKIFEQSIPTGVNENLPSRDVEREFFQYAFISDLDRKHLLIKIRLILFMIDILIVCLSLIIATVLYFDHFSYVHGGYEISTSSNQIRIACVIGSCIQIVLLVIRNKNLRTRELIKFYLNYYNQPVIKDLFNKNLFIEGLMHVLQPYPYLKFDFEIKVLGNDIKYSLNMLLFLLCILRFYYFYSIIDKWIIFSSEQAKRIYKFLVKVNSTIVITIKSILKYFGLFSNFTLFLVMTYLFALKFKVFEDFEPYNINIKKSPVTEITNCVWYIIVTMTAIGYGDIVPFTLIGRIVGVLCSIAGIFFIAMLFVFLVLYTTLDEEEYKVIYIILYILIGL